jgi:TolB-like protein
MAIWSAEIKELEGLYESIRGQLPDVEKELERLIKADDENMILLYSRRCLEVIITDLCECELKRPRKTEPLKGIIDKLYKEEKVPSHIISSMHGLNELSTYGTHPKDFDPEQVKPVLNNLDIIIKWYLKHKETGINIKPESTEKIRQELKSTEVVKKSITISKKRLISLVTGLILLIAIVVAVLLFTNIIGGGKQTNKIEKSIAVLPFRNDSPNDTNTYFINGIMEKVLNNLQMIKELRVISRTSVEQYRNTTKSIPEIAKEQGVNYIVEGSGQKYGNKFSISVQLLKAAKENHLWGDSYEREIKETKDIFDIQGQIALAIAAELKAVITPEEKQLIEKIPTTNVTALEFYQMGREEEKFIFYDLIISSTILAGVNPSIKQSLERAEKMYKTALKYDYTFAPAYTGLAGIYWSKNYFKEYFSRNFMDSVLILVDKALSFDDQLPDAYFIRGIYHGENDSIKQAFKEFDKTIKLNPNYWLAYFAKGNIDDDPLTAIKDYQEAASRNHGPGLSEIYNKISFKLSYTGFSELAKNYSLEAVKLESDSTKYYFWLWMYEFEYKKSYEFYKKKYSIYPSDLNTLKFLSDYYSVTGQFKESLQFYKKLLAEGGASINIMQRVGYAYWKNGFKDSADYYFNRQIENCNDAIRLGRSSYSSAAYYDLAGIYAFKGDKIKAYENLKSYNSRPGIYFLWIVRFIKTDPLFDNIRNEPEFQNIVKDMDAKYQAEHERVKKWLKEQGML